MEIELNASNLKNEIIQKLQKTMIFFNNYKGKMNPTEQAKILEAFDQLENEIKLVFQADDELDAILEPFKKEVEEQRRLIELQEKKLNQYATEEAENEPEDEYKGVIYRGKGT